MKKLLARILIVSSVEGAFLYEIIDFGYHPTKKDLRTLAFNMKFSTMMKKMVIRVYGKQFFDACDRLSYIMLNNKLRKVFA